MCFGTGTEAWRSGVKSCLLSWTAIHRIIADHKDKGAEQCTTLPGESIGGGTPAVKYPRSGVGQRSINSLKSIMD